MRSLACEPTCGGKCSAAQCFACLTSSATASAARRRSAGRGCERSSSNGWAAHPNLQRRPHAPAAGRGRLQVQIRRAFVGHCLLSSSQAYDWCFARVPAANVGSCALECASHFAPDRRADLQVPPHNAWLWRLKDEHRKLGCGGELPRRATDIIELFHQHAILPILQPMLHGVESFDLQAG
jgi:hypothetical protein